ncbi:RlpA-like double-psi beta-barrel-protein domain-containing protein-containing protein [Xylaria intraflava]|nr:RlpA-like double-psi beta-barrel-protein domain-containing protein-containing protein [Xylaria intraflava]
MQFLTNIVFAIAATAGLVAAAPASEAPAQLQARSQAGDLTYYAPGLGACGVTNSESDAIVALSWELFDKYTPNGNPNKNSLCGRQIDISLGGKTTRVTVEDRCTGCQLNDLDVTESVFQKLASPSAGRVKMTWNWV